MKIAIITRKAGCNFGSSLQAYAIHMFIEKWGYDNQLLNYDEYHHFLLWRIKPFLKSALYRILSLMPSTILDKYFKYIYMHLKIRNIQMKKYDEFEKKYIRPTKTIFKTSRQLAKAVSNCDVCVCGSDQIWSPLFFDPNFFLCFCDTKRTRLVAYAPSFGLSKLLNNQKKIRYYLNRFDSISAREITGRNIIKELTNRDVPVVLDPTMLLSKKEWDHIASLKPISSSYILCYFLGKKYIPYKFINDLKKETKLGVVNVTSFRTPNNIEGKQYNAIGPTDFISTIRNAKFICTDSFHATIFSILYKKEFFVFDKFDQQDRRNQNSRITTLLSLLKIKNRLVDYSEKYHSKHKINYKYVDIALKRHKTKSCYYLKNALKGGR